MSTDIQRLGYRPRTSYPLDLEVFAVADLRQWGSKEKVRTTHRYEFHMLISPALQRFKRFQQLVEERFAQWHQVADYASQLGYTEKGLARAVMASVGMIAKAFIAARIVLEAKRADSSPMYQSAARSIAAVEQDGVIIRV